jgi:hypothetical protein
MLQAFADSVCDSKRTPSERTRRILIPGIAAILTVWLVQSGLDLNSTNPAWILRVRIPFTHILPLIHWELIVSFAVAGAISALYGAFVNSSPQQRYIAALFPVFFEILKWLWLLRFPLAPWIDPAHPPYRFAKLPVAASIGYWLIHIVIPAAAAMGVLYLFNRWFYTNRQNGGMEPGAIR